jgi:hypothetical protein
MTSRLLSRNLKTKIYKTVILPVVLCGYGTWSLILRIFENMARRRLFGPKRDEIIGSWRKLHKELNKLYSSPNIIKMMKSRKVR